MNDDLIKDRLLTEVPLHEGYRVLGPVVLYRRLGKGGMGSVYLGRHMRLECEVAVKCLGPDLADDEEFVKRFRAEARSAAHLRHQNIVHVYDVDEAARLHFLVMEYVDGESAGDRVKRKGPLAEVEAVAICLGASRGLAHAHQKGFVHRDIKPDNVLISRDGAVKVADLGLAKPVGDAARSMATKSGIGFGTPAYMPPEQVRSAKEVGFTADVYSLGAMLYSLLTGDRPFRGTDVLDVLQKVVSEPFPDVRVLRPDVSAATAELIARATSKDPAARYRDASELADALAKLVKGREPSLADASSGDLGETRPLVSPPPVELLSRIGISMRAVEAAPSAPPPPAPTGIAPERRARWPLVAGLLVVLAGTGAALQHFRVFESRPPDRAARDVATPDASRVPVYTAAPPRIGAEPVALSAAFLGASSAAALVQRDYDTALADFRASRPAAGSAEERVYRARIEPAVAHATEGSDAVQGARAAVELAADLKRNPALAAGVDVEALTQALPGAQALLGSRAAGLRHAAALVGELATAEARYSVVLAQAGAIAQLGAGPLSRFAELRSVWDGIEPRLVAADFEGARESARATTALSDELAGALAAAAKERSDAERRALDLAAQRGRTDAADAERGSSQAVALVPVPDPSPPVAAPLDGEAAPVPADATDASVSVPPTPVDVLVRELAWAETLSALPDPAVVTDAAHRSRMEATGLPWRVRDKRSGVVLLLVPPGEFARGTGNTAHRVRIAQPFYLGQYELTQEDWTQMGGAVPSRAKVGERLPLVLVHPPECEARLRTFGLRLARESEWEYAARADGEERRSLDEIAWHARNAGKVVRDVGTRAPNAWGFHDMIGNVWEWCATKVPKGDARFVDFARRPQPVDSRVDDESPGALQVLRGGSISDSGAALDPRNRAPRAPESNTARGFRVARDP